MFSIEFSIPIKFEICKAIEQIYKAEPQSRDGLKEFGGRAHKSFALPLI
jgi:hypothetical protein